MSGPVSDILGAVREIVYGGEDAALDAVDERCDDFDQLWAWHRALSSIRKAAWQLSEALEKGMIAYLADDAVRMDDFIVRVVPEAPARRIKDQAALADYLGLSTGAQLAFRTTDIKIQGVRAYAQSVGDDPDVIEDKFFEWVGEEGAPKLVMNRMEYAPRWALGLRHGERMKQPDGGRSWPK